METPVDLESYIARYTGFSKVQRLLFIAEKCPALQGAFRASARARSVSTRARGPRPWVALNRAFSLAPPLGRAAEAYRRAVDELRKGLNTALYQEVMAKTGGTPCWATRPARSGQGRQHPAA